MMKTAFVWIAVYSQLLLLLAERTSAWVVGGNSRPFRATTPSTTTTTTTAAATALGSRPDASNAIEEALRISKEYGATSPEARVAWDAVEEMDASDMSPATGDGAKTALQQLSDEEIHQYDYANQIASLSYLLESTNEKIAQIKTLASSIRELELEDTSLTKLPKTAGSLKTALAEAKAAKELHGANSPQALEAWQEVEECASEEECDVETMYRYSAAALKAHHYYDAVVDASFLQEAIDALDTVESLRRFVQVEDQRLKKDPKK